MILKVGLNVLSFGLITWGSLFTTNSWAMSESCYLTTSKDAIGLTWTAYKTAKKAGVPGTFSTFDFNLPAGTNSLKEIVTKSSFTIDLSSVNTQDPIRDGKIKEFFFLPFKNQAQAKGKFTLSKKGKLTLVLTMNGVTKSIPMEHTFDNNHLLAKGELNVLNFSASKSLKALGEACLAKHEGKTWPQVGLSLSVQFSKVCPEAKKTN